MTQTDTKKLLPGWLLKLLASAFIAGLLAIAGHLNAETEKLKTNDKDQEVEITQIKSTTDANLIWIRESLSRIETEVKENKNEH